jgi:hypothetical protein
MRPCTKLPRQTRSQIPKSIGIHSADPFLTDDDLVQNMIFHKDKMLQNDMDMTAARFWSKRFVALFGVEGERYCSHEFQSWILSFFWIGCTITLRYKNDKNAECYRRRLPPCFESAEGDVGDRDGDVGDRDGDVGERDGAHGDPSNESRCVRPSRNAAWTLHASFFVSCEQRPTNITISLCTESNEKDEITQMKTEYEETIADLSGKVSELERNNAAIGT